MGQEPGVNIIGGGSVDPLKTFSWRP